LKWVLFFQDTNGLLFKVSYFGIYFLSSDSDALGFLSIYFKYSLPHNLRIQAIPAALGVSASKQYHVNSLAVPRKAKEAIGGITRLTHSDGKLIVSSPTDKENNANSGLNVTNVGENNRIAFCACHSGT